MERDPVIVGRSVSLLVMSLAALAAGAGPAEAVLLPQAGSVHLRATTEEAGDDVPVSASGSLPFFYDLYGFRGAGGTTEVVASFAVPAAELRREDGDGAVRYRFDVTLVLSDTATHTVSRTDDSVYVAVPEPLDDDHLLHTHVTVQAPPSARTLQRVIMFDATVPGVGQYYGSPYRIPDYRGDSLMISDIALGLPEGGGGWTRRDATLALLPSSQFPGSSFDVYYEIYNLPADHPYTTDISVERLDAPGDDSPPLHTRFTGEAATGDDGILGELRRVDATLDEGRYRLTVTVTDRVSGRSVSRSRVLEVRGWEPGTTLVPALPRHPRVSTTGS